MDKRKGSGRTKGAVSLVSVQMKDLIEKFSPESIVVVGRVFIEKAGIKPVAPAIKAPVSEEVKQAVVVVI